MSEQDNVHLVQDAYAAFGRGDIKTLLDLMTEDAHWHIPGPPEIIPLSGRRRGREQIAEFFALHAQMQEAELFSPREFFSGGNKVVVLGEYRWRVKSSGRTFSSDWVHVFTVEDGKITGFQEHLDTEAAANAYRRPLAS